MRSMLWMCAFTLGLVALPEWRVALEPGHGCWPPRCDADQVPLATPVVAHEGRLVMIGDGAAPNDGYESIDGRTWRHFAHDAGWGARYKAADASYRGALWRVGGWGEEGGRRTAKNDVWRSTDGRQWELVTPNAPWPPRSDAKLRVFRDTLWLIGGDANDSRLWLTTDGRLWIPRATHPLGRPNPQGVVVLRDALWIIGHGQWDSATSDVWTSSNGSTWTRVTAAAAWPARTGAAFAALGDRMWVIGGVGYHDAWWSTDGSAWHRAKGELPGPPRSATYSVVFQNAIWVIGGKTGGAGGTGFWDGIAVLK